MTTALYAELWTLGCIAAVCMALVGGVMLVAYLNLEPVDDLP